MVRISELSATQLAACSKHIALLNSLVPALAPPAGVAFALVAFARQRRVLRARTSNRQEQVWLDRLTELEEEWWRWCSGASGTLPRVAAEAERVATAMERLDPPEPLHQVHLTGAAILSAFERGDYAYGRYSAMANLSVIDLLEEYLPEATIDQLVFREIERQEQELLVLMDGVDPDTRARLVASAGANELVGEYLELIPVATLPAAW